MNPVYKKFSEVELRENMEKCYKILEIYCPFYSEQGEFGFYRFKFEEKTAISDLIHIIEIFNRSQIYIKSNERNQATLKGIYCITHYCFFLFLSRTMYYIQANGKLKLLNSIRKKAREFSINGKNFDLLFAPDCPDIPLHECVGKENFWIILSSAVRQYRSMNKINSMKRLCNYYFKNNMKERLEDFALVISIFPNCRSLLSYMRELGATLYRVPKKYKSNIEKHNKVKKQEASVILYDKDFLNKDVISIVSEYVNL